MTDFFDDGWQVFAPEPATINWANAARGAADCAIADPENAHLLQCGGTWFVGLDALDNKGDGDVNGSGPFVGAARDFVHDNLGGWPALHRGQVSVTYPGYPRPRDGESDAGFRYRKNRDAAHVDGIIGLGTSKRRFVLEPHQFIIGVALNNTDENAAPLTVWKGSHHIIKRAFEGYANEDLSKTDVTDIYLAARKEVFETCERTIVHGAAGSAMVLHRHVLHGVAPWQDGARADGGGRMIAYFRPLDAGGARAWCLAR